MSPATKAATRLQPIQALREQIIALDAAMLVALTSTEEGAVHKLRTSTRRVQAHLTLVDLLHGDADASALSAHRKKTSAVSDRLRRVRRAAGSVRDLDVQIETIRLDAPHKSSVHKGTPGDAVRHQAKKLRKHLQSEREAQARQLVHTLKQQEQELAVELLALEAALKTLKGRSLSAPSLVSKVTLHFAEGMRPLLESRGKQAELRKIIEALREDDLHTVRKLAKLCRYMLESAGRGTTAQQPAEQFEALQEAGGRWHDWLLLQQLSEDFHGRKAELTQRYYVHAEACLADYYLRLNELLPTLMKR